MAAARSSCAVAPLRRLGAALLLALGLTTAAHGRTAHPVASLFAPDVAGRAVLRLPAGLPPGVYVVRSGARAARLVVE